MGGVKEKCDAGFFWWLGGDAMDKSWGEAKVNA
jgi:hypothetical protein